MNPLKGTKTAKNLMTAFAGESQARNRYTYFASKARQEGFVQIGRVSRQRVTAFRRHFSNGSPPNRT